MAFVVCPLIFCVLVVCLVAGVIYFSVDCCLAKKRNNQTTPDVVIEPTGNTTVSYTVHCDTSSVNNFIITSV